MAYIDSFKALADPTRCKVFEMLNTTPQSVGEMAAKLPVSRPAVSQHLKILTDAGLINVTPKGNRRIYAVRQKGLQEIRDYFDQFWGDALTAFAEKINTENENDT